MHALGAVAAIAAAFTPSAGRAVASNEELAAEIKELKAQLKEMRAAISANRTETRRASARIKAVATRAPAPATSVAAPAIPADATPVFVTAAKQLQFGAITITPGGYFAGESVYRTRQTGSDISSNFGAIPTLNNPIAHTGEFRPSARNTRAALLAEAAITPKLIASGYGEFDFLSATNTANSNQSNSYTPRIRHLYATLDDNQDGWHFLAGQAYSLVTLNSKGITPRNEITPTVIDAAQTVGSIYARQAQVRVVKDFDGKLWLGLSAEESESTFAPGCATANGVTTGIQGNNPGSLGLTNVANITCSAVGTIANSGQTNYSLNHIPDVIGKAAYEANLAGHDVHLEVFGLYTDLYDRVDYSTPYAGYYTGQNKDRTGWGVGGGLIAAIVPRRLDFQINALYGRGIGRYGASQLADTSYAPQGGLSALPETIALAGATFHATPAIDIYGYAGIESAQRSYFETAGGTYVGVGAPSITDAGCNTELSTACSGTNKRVYEITGGFWDKLYKGSFGEVRAGVQYAYLNRELFNAPGLASPSVNDQEIFTSFRYYPFQ